MWFYEFNSRFVGNVCDNWKKKKNVQRNFRKQILLTKLNWCVVFFICIHCNAAHCQHSIFDFFFHSFFIFFALQCRDLKGLASERKKREKKTFKLNFCVTSFEKNFLCHCRWWWCVHLCASIEKYHFEYNFPILNWINN